VKKWRRQWKPYLKRRLGWPSASPQSADLKLFEGYWVLLSHWRS
jgi:hypothetical protein